MENSNTASRVMIFASCIKIAPFWYEMLESFICLVADFRHTIDPYHLLTSCNWWLGQGLNFHPRRSAQGSLIVREYNIIPKQKQFRGCETS